MRDVLNSSEDSPLKHHFLNDISYRCDQRNQTNLFAGISEWRVIRNRKPGKDNLETNSIALILTSSKHSMIQTKSYIEQNLGVTNLSIVFRDDLVFQFKSFAERMSYCLFVLKISTLCFWRKKHRLNLALCIREVLEWARILELLQIQQRSLFIDFSGYEKDSNALTKFLQIQGFEVVKVPSPGPLQAHYKYVVSDTLVLSSAYQQEEISNLSSQWDVKQFAFWPPEQFHQYESVYQNQAEPPAQTIGFYSHGEWLRRAQGHADPGLDILTNEEALLKDLSVFLRKNPSYQLIIFPHPKERNSELTSDYYQDKLSGVAYQFSEQGLPSSHLFHTVDIGLMAYSTLIFERLGMGYKTFIAKYTPSVFPVTESQLNAVLFHDAASLENQILKTENENRSKYFERNNLSNHLISNFTRQLNH
jgi:hypothetical protein